MYDLQNLWNDSRANESAEEIVAHLKFIIEDKLRIDETLAVASAIHDHLVDQLKTITDPTDRLMVARKARDIYEQVRDENTEKHCAEARKSWEQGRRDLADWVEGGKIGVKPLWAFPTAAELSGSSSKSGAPAAPETEAEEI